ncbi:NUFIP1-like protein [Gracilaria domingensis]|nr:NUFIP1-like protein [Gracilaria domingensis]
MNWPWPTPPHPVYPQQPLDTRPPQVQKPPTPYLPPPPPIAQLLPPVNFYGNLPIPPPPAFRQFPTPSSQVHQIGYCTASPPYIPSHHNPSPQQNSSEFQPGYNHQRRWNRHQSIRVKDRRSRNTNLSRVQDASRTSISQQQSNKKQHCVDQAAAQEVLSRLNAKLPGSSPADIEAWVSARKANWPSKANVERKKAATLKRQQAGALDTTSRNASQVRHKSDCTQRDLDASRNVLSRLNAKLPGSSPQEIDTWVKARKANWPSRRNVERKLLEEAQKNETKEKINEANSASGAMEKLGDYSSSEDDDEKVEDKQKKAHINRGKRTRKKQGGRGKDKNSRRKVQVRASDGKPTLLRMLLEREIRQEQSVLLQAFRYIITKKAFEMS